MIRSVNAMQMFIVSSVDVTQRQETYLVFWYDNKTVFSIMRPLNFVLNTCLVIPIHITNIINGRGTHKNIIIFKKIKGASRFLTLPCGTTSVPYVNSLLTKFTADSFPLEVYLRSCALYCCDHLCILLHHTYREFFWFVESLTSPRLCWLAVYFLLAAVIVLPRRNAPSYPQPDIFLP